MNRPAVLMSIKPQYSELIFSGRKTVELRRVCPKMEAGDVVLVYASGPRMALVGGFEVGGIVTATPDAMFRNWGKAAGVTREAFDCYFAGSSTAYGICIARAWSFRKEAGLKALRDKLKGFHPPQSYRYLRSREVTALVPFTSPHWTSGEEALVVSMRVKLEQLDAKSNK